MPEGAGSSDYVFCFTSPMPLPEQLINIVNFYLCQGRMIYPASVS